MAISETRTFGVEIEHGNIGNSGEIGNMRRIMRDAGFEKWDRVGVDGSGIELPSPILCGKDGLAELKAVVTLLKKIGGYTGPQDGLHVHHGFPEGANGDEEAVYRLAASWFANQKNISSFLPARRHSTHHWGRYVCREWIASDLQNIKTRAYERAKVEEMPEEKARVINEGLRGLNRYRALNFQPLAAKGTVEIRQHHGTLDWAQIEAWIIFGQYFIDKAVSLKDPMPDYGTGEGLCAALRMSKAHTRTLTTVTPRA